MLKLFRMFQPVPEARLKGTDIARTILNHTRLGGGVGKGAAIGGNNGQPFRQRLINHHAIALVQGGQHKEIRLAVELGQPGFFDFPYQRNPVFKARFCNRPANLLAIFRITTVRPCQRALPRHALQVFQRLHQLMLGLSG